MKDLAVARLYGGVYAPIQNPPPPPPCPSSHSTMPLPASACCAFWMLGILLVAGCTATGDKTAIEHGCPSAGTYFSKYVWWAQEGSTFELYFHNKPGTYELSGFYHELRVDKCIVAPLLGNYTGKGSFLVISNDHNLIFKFMVVLNPDTDFSTLVATLSVQYPDRIHSAVRASYRSSKHPSWPYRNGTCDDVEGGNTWDDDWYGDKEPDSSVYVHCNHDKL